MQFHFTRVSMNRKTGPIPVTTTSSDSCPPNCSFKGAGCYAEHGNLHFHWKAVDRLERGGSFDQLLEHIRRLPRGQLWRHNQAGDLPTVPHRADQIDLHNVLLLAAANRGRRGFTYTHHLPTKGNVMAVRAANASGFTVNWSAENLRQADQYLNTRSGPVVSVLAMDAQQPLRTPQGRPVVICPATTGDTDCAHCQLCQQASRKTVIGFPAHGTRAKTVQAVFLQNEQLELAHE